MEQAYDSPTNLSVRKPNRMEMKYEISVDVFRSYFCFDIQRSTRTWLFMIFTHFKCLETNVFPVRCLKGLTRG